MHVVRSRITNQIAYFKQFNRLVNKRCMHVKSKQMLALTTKVIDQTLTQSKLFYSNFSPVNENVSSLDPIVYNSVSEETLESLTDYFEEIIEGDSDLQESDVSYSSGVLTVNLGKHGTYVINKQTPNKQIWLSSPTSGPKRYDFSGDTWIYKHTGESLHFLLQKEIGKIIKAKVDFTRCTFSKFSV